MIFLPRALSVASMGFCSICLFDVLEILEMNPTTRGGIGIQCRTVRVCSCGVEGRDEDQTCKEP